MKHTSFKNKNVLVTGGAGFIGSHIVEELLKKKNIGEVKILDNLSTGKMSNINPFLKKYKNCKFIKGDITNVKTCEKATKNIDYVFHEAALVSVPISMEDPILNNKINVDGFLNILCACKKNKVKRVVYASSAAVYGNNPKLPKNEEMKAEFSSPYGLTKYIDELYAKLFSDENVINDHKLQTIGLRYFNVFGPRQDPKSPYSGVISIFVDRLSNKDPKVKITIFGTPSKTRDFVYVKNVVQANLKAMTIQDKNAIGKVYNVGTAKKTSLKTLFNTIKKITKSVKNYIQGKPRPGDIQHSLANITSIKKHLGYKPEINLEKQLKKTIESIKFSKRQRK